MVRLPTAVVGASGRVPRRGVGPRLVVAAALLGALAATVALVRWSRHPDRVLGRFLSAISDRDFEKAPGLVLPAQVKAVGLTGQRLRGFWEALETDLTPRGRLRPGRPTEALWQGGGKARECRTARVSLLEAATGQRLPGTDPRGVFTVPRLRRLGRSYYVDIGMFMVGIFLTRWGADREGGHAHAHELAVLTRAGWAPDSLIALDLAAHEHERTPRASTQLLP